MPLPPLKNPESLIERLKQLSTAVPVSGYLMSTLALFNVMQTMSLGALPFSKKAFRKINRELANAYWTTCDDCARVFNDAELILSGDDVPQKESVIVIANHQEMPDITWLMNLARQKERLGDMKWFIKDEFRWVPGIGPGLKFLDCLFVKRDWAEDADTINGVFKRIIDDKIPIWLMLFPEGTRFTPEKLKRADAYAEKAGLKKTSHVLQARTSGFVASVQALRQHIDAVYDITIAYEEGVPTLWQYVKGTNRRAHLNVRRIPISEMPESKDELTTWLHESFQRKDSLLEAFYEDGAFS